jgi:hypothetical protein
LVIISFLFISTNIDGARPVRMVFCVMGDAEMNKKEGGSMACWEKA